MASVGGGSGLLGGATGGGNAELHEFATAETWQVLSGLSSPVVVRVALDGLGMSGGELALQVDGSVVATVLDGERDARVVRPTSSLSIISRRSTEVNELRHASHLTEFSVSGQDGTPTGVEVSPDGTVMIVSGEASNRLLEYSLSTPFDLSTASFVDGFDISGQDTSVRDLTVVDGGAKIYITGDQNDASFHYDLTAPWDVSTASFVRGLPTLESSGLATGIAIAGVGVDEGHLLMDLGFDTTLALSRMTTAWDMRTTEQIAELPGSALAQIRENMRGIYLSADQRRMFICGRDTEGTNETGYCFDVEGMAGSGSDITFRDRVDLSAMGVDFARGLAPGAEGQRAYVADGAGSSIHQLDLTSVFAGTGLASVVRA